MSLEVERFKTAVRKGREDTVAYIQNNFCVKGKEFIVPRINKNGVSVYLYYPKDWKLEKDKLLPAIFNVHGGAWIGNDALVLDSQSQEMADRLYAMVININYTKVDIKPFPYPQQEIFDTVCYFSEHAKEYKIDPNQFVLRGYSAGGHLCAAAAQMLLAAGKRLAGQILCYPFLDFTYVGKEGKIFDDQEHVMEEVFFSELPKENILCSPGRQTSKNLCGLAPTLLITCGEDPLYYHAIEYKNKLKEANVSVKHIHYETARHGFLEVNYRETKEFEARTEEQKKLALECEGEIESLWREEKIKKLLSQMTLKEKIGQLRQCGPSLVGAFDVDFEELVNMVYDGRISGAEFQKLMSTAEQDFHEEDLRAGKIGSYNGITDAKVINRLQKIAVEESRLGIPLLFGYDVVHGYRTITPIPLGESCAWNPALWEETARMSAVEAASGGIHMTFAPMVDVAKDARWGRISEGAGEDSLLNTVYGEAKVRGFQGKDLKESDTLAACVKHFAGYGAVESGRDYNRVDMSMQRLYEEYLEPYRACVKSGASAVMPAFNDINGVPCSVNEWLLQDILRKEWEFDGMTVSDANAIAECVEHGIVKDRAEAAASALHAGVDMDMTSDCYSENLETLIRSGKVPEDELDCAAANILRTKMKLGLFEHPYRTDEEKERCTILKPEFREVALRSAEESIVLLKNEGVLPLREETCIGIVGKLAGLRAEMTGTWAIKANGEDCVSILDACREQKRKYIVCTEEAVLSGKSPEELFKECGVILAAVGEQKNESGEAASRTNIELPDVQKEMLRKLSEAGKPVIAVLFNGRPLAIGALKEQADAILEAWHPGIEAGSAILNILYGKVNPSGKLTTTFPYTSGQCPMYYDHINTGRPAGKSKFTSKYLDAPSEPVYPFGYGLSYTTFEYSDLEVTEEMDRVIVRAAVKNTGDRDGMEVVQCYFHDPAAKRVRPVKKLLDFEKVKLSAGEEKKVCFVIPKERLGYYDMQMNFLIEAGEYEFYVGGNSQDCRMCRLNLEA